MFRVVTSEVNFGLYFMHHYIKTSSREHILFTINIKRANFFTQANSIMFMIQLH
jgi:hypothetical protein